MTAARLLAAAAALFVLATSARAADDRCARSGDSDSARNAAPSEIQVLWSRKSLTYANTTDHYATCSYTVDGSEGNHRVETYLKPGQSVTRSGVSGITSNPAHCTIYTATPCDIDDRWDG